MEKYMNCKNCKKPITTENYIGKTICEECDKKHLVDAKRTVRKFYKKYNVSRRMYVPTMARL